MCKSAACAKLDCANAFCSEKKNEVPKTGRTQTLHYVKMSYEAKQDCAMNHVKPKCVCVRASAISDILSTFVCPWTCEVITDDISWVITC